MHRWKQATVNPFRCTDLYTQQLLADRHTAEFIQSIKDTAEFHKHPLAHVNFNQYLLVSHKLTVCPMYARATTKKGATAKGQYANTSWQPKAFWVHSQQIVYI